MSPGQAFTAAVAGVLMVVSGLVWLFGPWSLVACGVVLVAFALLIPVKERRAEPVEEAVPPVS